MEQLRSDLTHALRRLARAPGYTLVAILTLALGIGANTAMFSLVKTVILRPLPYGDPDRLAIPWATHERGETTWLSGPELADYASETSTFESVASYTGSAANLTGGVEPQRVAVGEVTPNLFHTLRANALVGRTFAASDSASVIKDEVVLTHQLWMQRFGGMPDVIGSTIQLNGQARTIIGVMPASFKLPLDYTDERPSELFVPLDMTPYSTADEWGDHSFIGVMRLREGVSNARAVATMRVLEGRWVRDGHWDAHLAMPRDAVPVATLVLGDVRSAMWILLGAVAAILLIACANVANLSLARADERVREVAVRTALGASQSRIVRQLFTESFVVSLAGASLGVGLATLAMRLVVALHPAGIPRVDDLHIDGAVLAVTFALTVATAVLFGSAPAIELSRPNLNSALKEGGRGTVGRGRQRFRDALAASQVAFSIILLVGAALLVRSFVELRRVNLGFNPVSALTFRTVLPQASYDSSAKVVGFYENFRARLAELPGVRVVGATRILPLTGTIGDWSITVEGRDPAPGDNPNGDWQVVTPGYFEAMGMTLVKGRFFTNGDNANAPIVAVVNQPMADKYWNGDAIGKRFRIGSTKPQWITIVGVAKQVKHNAVTEGARTEMYVPHAQWGAAGANTPRGLTFVVRTAGDPMAVLGYVRTTLRQLDPNLPLADIHTLQSVADDALSQARFTTMLLALFAALALTLAAIGIYGVIALLVARRRGEIGIRMALGARPSRILAMVVQRGLVMTGAGVAVGLIGALLLVRVLTSLLYGVTPLDPITFAIAPTILAIVALVACVVPARRAAAVDPVVALKSD
jgi:putative ABC transport system permease protein